MKLRISASKIPKHIRKFFKPVGYKPKDMVDMPHLLVEALRADGWWYRTGMPWVKRSAMPSSVKDAPSSALEYMFLLTKSPKYFFDMTAIKKNYKQSSINRADNSQVTTSNPDRPVAFKRSLGNGRNFRNTDLFYESIKPPHGMIFCGDEPVGLDVNPQAMKEAHFATFPEKLIEPCILAGTSEKGCCNQKIKKLKIKENLKPEEIEKVMDYLQKKGLA